MRPSHLFRAVLFPALLSSTSVFAATASEWRSRSIYQVMTDRFALPHADPALPTNACNATAQRFCGGTWAAIEQNLDYIQGMGFTAIWISPVSENIPGPTAYGDPYHGYWVQDVTKLNSQFGTDADLRSLIAAVHARGMFIMVDVVVNNVAGLSTSFEPKFAQLPYLFKDEADYHPYAPIDYGNLTSEQLGWLGDEKLPLPDLNTQSATVRSTLQAYVRSFVQDYSIDGLRIDAAKHVEASFWPPFCGEQGAAGVFCIGEVFGSDVQGVAEWQGPLDAVLNYPTYFAVRNAFSIPGPKNMTGLVQTIAQSQATFTDTKVLGNFLENHDNPRWAGFSVDPMTRLNALIFSFLTDGIPVMYYGIEQAFTGQGDPENREPLWPSGYNKTQAYTQIASLNQFRNFLVNSKTHPWMEQNVTVVGSNDVDIILNKGGAILVLNNLGSPPSDHRTVIASTGYQTSTVLVDIISCQHFVVASQGSLLIQHSQGARPLVLYPGNWLQGSGICNFTDTSGDPANSPVDTGSATPSFLASWAVIASLLLAILPLSLS